MRRRKPRPIDEYLWLKRSVHGPAVYFVLGEPLTRDRFRAAWTVLQKYATGSAGDGVEAHWEKLQQRLTGEQPRWHDLVPYVDLDSIQSHEDGVRFRASWHSTTNLVHARGYTANVVDGVRCTLDYFNPANELGLRYPGAGEHVLTLVLQFGAPPLGPALRPMDTLAKADTLFAALRELDAVLEPEHVVGSYTLYSVLETGEQGRIDQDIRPWEFGYPMFATRVPDGHTIESLRGAHDLRIMGTDAPNETFRLARVDNWGDGRVLVLGAEGFSAGLTWAVSASSKLFGRVHFHQMLFPVFTFHRDAGGGVRSHRHRKSQIKKAEPS